MIKERVKQQVGHLLKPALGFGLAPEGTSLETLLQNNLLSPEEKNQALLATGRELARIHEKSGKKFGWIGKSDNEAIAFLNTLGVAMSRNFSGKYDTYYGFLMDFYDSQSHILNNTFREEEETGNYLTELSKDQREKMNEIRVRIPEIRQRFENRKKLLSEVQPHVLHGNVYEGNIIIDKHNKYSGLTDFAQMLVGPPEDEMAYIYVMPDGKQIVQTIKSGWEETSGKKIDPELEELLKLWQAMRKTTRRYLYWKYLGKLSGPLDTVLEQLEIVK
jgi:fructosamine-3-kinase